MVTHKKSKRIYMNRALTLEERTQQAYSNNNEQYNPGVWFYDVEDRFRKFEYNGICYIAKRCDRIKARDELNKSARTSKIIDGTNICGMTLRVVVPDIIDVVGNIKQAYLVLPFIGKDLNTLSYEAAFPKLEAKQYIEIIEFLMGRGIVHSGFLPRNIIEVNNEMYLLDLEDVVLSKLNMPVRLNRLWYTNFLLNWSYLFDRHILEELLSKIIEYKLEEPQLVRYEQTFKDMTGYLTDNSDLRNIIEQIVFDAEMPVRSMQKHCIRPNDLGHLIADIYPTEIDIIHDISACVVRRRNEARYRVINRFESILVRQCWSSGDREKIDHYVMNGLLALMDDNLSTNAIASASHQQTPLAAINTIVEQSPSSLISLYTRSKLDVNNIREHIATIIHDATNIKSESDLQTKAAEIIVKLQKKGNHKIA